MIHSLWHALITCAERVQCPACRFWYDPDYGHGCVPC